MTYKYDLGKAANMSNQELLNALMAREIAPKTIVGTGYINSRQVAIDYLKEMIEKERERASELQARADKTNPYLLKEREGE